MQELGGRMMTILNKYARDNGYALVMDGTKPVRVGFQARHPDAQ